MSVKAPKVIHYCWFGGAPLPPLAKKCIASWKRYLPEYEIKEWNEDNFDINITPFVREAYDAGKYAFVSDYARLWCVYQHGGVYFDTDVEVIAPMDDILECGGYMAYEKHEHTPECRGYVNLGLGFASAAGNPILADIMSYYENTHYLLPDGSENKITIVLITTKVLEKYGLSMMGKLVELPHGITVYPWEYFCPIEYPYKKIEKTANTRTIHHYSESWLSVWERFIIRRGAFFATPVGRVIKRIIRSILRRN